MEGTKDVRKVKRNKRNHISSINNNNNNITNFSRGDNRLSNRRKWVNCKIKTKY